MTGEQLLHSCFPVLVPLHLLLKAAALFAAVVADMFHALGP